MQCATPKTQPGGSCAATWFSFWCATGLLLPKKSDRSNAKNRAQRLLASARPGMENNACTDEFIYKQKSLGIPGGF